MDNNLDYIQGQFNKIEKYEQLTHEFEGWFKKLDYNQLKDKDWYQKIESAVINHLAKKNYQDQFTGYADGYSIRIEDERIYQELKIISKLNESEFQSLYAYGNKTEEERNQEKFKYKSNIDKLRKKLFETIDGIDQTYLNNIFNDELDNFEGKNRDDTPAKFIYGQAQNVAKKQEGKYYSTEPRWFGDSDKFRTEIFKIVNRLESFKTEAKKAFSAEKSFDIVQEPVIDFWSLIWLENFVSELEDYFKQGDNERENHKLKKIFSYILIDSINAKNLSQKSGYKNSFAWRNIILEQDSSIPEKNKQTIFCSLVEFYGKDFFDGLPENEKRFILDFYKEHPEFKLSDPSIIKDSHPQNEKLNNFDKNLNQHDLSIDKDKNKILKTNENKEIKEINENKILITDDNTSSDPSIIENIDSKNRQTNNLTTNNNTKPKSRKIKQSYTKARVGTVILGISFVISLILAWQISIYILIASAILLTMLIICLIVLKKNGFECTKIFSCCMDVEDEPETEISKDNNLINPRLNKAEKLID